MTCDRMNVELTSIVINETAVEAVMNGGYW